MRGVYTANFRINNLAAAKTLLYITVAASKPVEMLYTEISNEDNETNEQLVACWQLITSLGTPTATTITPAKHEKGDQDAACVVKANVTASEPTYGAIAQDAAIVNVIGLRGFPSLGGYIYAPAPEERVLFGSADTWGLRLLVAPTAVDTTIEVRFRELGG